MNKEIRRTILEEPRRFFPYNNGISATAEEVVDERRGGVTYVNSLTNLQIVNGGQTTASIFNALKKEKGAPIDQVTVQMKLSGPARRLRRNLCLRFLGLLTVRTASAIRTSFRTTRSMLSWKTFHVGWQPPSRTVLRSLHTGSTSVPRGSTQTRQPTFPRQRSASFRPEILGIKLFQRRTWPSMYRRSGSCRMKSASVRRRILESLPISSVTDGYRTSTTSTNFGSGVQ